MAEVKECVCHSETQQYPQGLEGQQIPLSARIFAIADILDAITSERPYQRASSFEFARDRIRHLSGAAFDPQVVNAFPNIRGDVWAALAKNQGRAKSSPEFCENSAMLRMGLGPIS